MGDNRYNDDQRCPKHVAHYRGLCRWRLLTTWHTRIRCNCVSGGVVHSNSNGLYTLAGSGAILNVMLVTYLSAGLVLLLQDKLGQLKLIFLPTIVLLVGGSIGLVTLPWMLTIQGFIGSLVASATHFSPLPMGVILGIAFAALIVSPLSSVGIATAINLAGVGAGAANAGIVAGA